MIRTFYWFDFETLGTNPARHWPVQFAGIRTDAEFNEIGEPLEILAKVPDDQLPEPQAKQSRSNPGQKQSREAIQDTHELNVKNSAIVQYN